MDPEPTTAPAQPTEEQKPTEETSAAPLENPPEIPQTPEAPPQTEPQPAIPETPVEEPPPSPQPSLEATADTAEVFDSEAQTRGATEGQASPEPAVPPATTPVVEAPPHAQPSLKSFLVKALQSIQFRKRAKLEKIMKLAGEKRSITNDQVQKLLRVSDATATRYLSALVREGRLQRFGNRGSARYEPTIGSIPTV